MDKFKLVLSGLINGLKSKKSALNQLEDILFLISDKNEENFDIAVANKCYLLNKILDYLIPYFEKEGSKTLCLDAMEKACQLIYRDNFEKMAMVVIKNGPSGEEIPKLWLIVQSYPDVSNNTSNPIYKITSKLINKIDSVKTLIEVLKRTYKESDQLRIFSLLRRKGLTYNHWKMLESGWFFNLSEKAWIEISKEIFNSNPRKEGLRACFNIVKNLTASSPKIKDFIEWASEEFYKISKETNDLILILCIKFNFLRYQDEICEEIANELKNRDLNFEELQEMYENTVFMILEGFDTCLQRDYKISLEDAINESTILDLDEETKEALDEFKEDPFTFLYLMYKKQLDEEAQNELLNSAKRGLNLDISKN